MISLSAAQNMVKCLYLTQCSGSRSQKQFHVQHRLQFPVYRGGDIPKIFVTAALPKTEQIPDVRNFLDSR